jgi:uncharacterized protein
MHLTSRSDREEWMGASQVGSIGWVDLTVEHAPEIRDFYRAVVGWGSTEVEMESYQDYGMTLPGGESAGEMVAGICHARGPNAGLPAQWLIYITVADLDASLARCQELGGRVLGPPRSMTGHGRYAVLADPAGAVAALFEPERS